MKVHLIAAARPNFMKVAPLYRALAAEPWCNPRLIHAGQHYDPEMSAVFLHELGLPEPHMHLGVGGRTHAEQTARVMVAYERACVEDRPDWTVVVGDVNATLACTIAAKKLNILVAHLEAGLRSRDRTMPEELNRILTDAVADLHWTPSIDADENLLSEGVPPDRIKFVGNIMIDSFELQRSKIETAESWRQYFVQPGRYGVVTLHRPANVDHAEILECLVDNLISIAARIPLVFPVHPRTRERLEEFGLHKRLEGSRVILAAPLGYTSFMSLLQGSCFAITDSGGLQEETTYMGVPCLTLRDSTERPITISMGTNRLVTFAGLSATVDTAIGGSWPKGSIPELWDGRASARVVASLKEFSAGSDKT